MSIKSLESFLENVFEFDIPLISFVFLDVFMLLGYGLGERISRIRFGNDVVNGTSWGISVYWEFCIYLRYYYCVVQNIIGDIYMDLLELAGSNRQWFLMVSHIFVKIVNL